MIEINEIYNKPCEEGLLQIDDKSIDLIIGDSPYFEVKGDFDFIWASFDDYLKDVEKWAIACKRVLKPNGTLLWYGHAKKIAYVQIIFDKYFNLENSLVWNKKECQTLRSSFEDARCFAPVTERILMYSNFNQNENDWRNNNATVYYEGFEPIRLYLRNEIKKVGLKICADYLAISPRAIGHWISKSQWYIPSDDNVIKLQNLGIFKEFETIKKEFETIKKEFETKHRRWFDNYKKYTDVLVFSQETHITKNYEHDTKKPETLTRALILTCSRENDLILVPFVGSGTEVAMAKKENRNYIGFETNPKYIEMAKKRLDNIQQTKMF